MDTCTCTCACQVLLEGEDLAVDDEAVEPEGPGVAGAAVLKLADLLRLMTALSWPELLRQVGRYMAATWHLHHRNVACSR